MSSEHNEIQSLAASASVRFGGFSFDRETNLLFEQGEIVNLSPKACELLAAFINEPNKVISKTELIDKVWPDTFVEESNLTHHIASLRKCFGPDNDFIETIPKKGYRFRAPIVQREVDVVVVTEERTTLIEFEENESTTANQPKMAIAIGVVVATLILSVAFGAWSLLGRSLAVQTSDSEVILSVPGNINSYDISSDGKMIAFAWNKDKQNTSNIFVQMIGSGEPLQLTSTDNDISPTWSPDGKTLAFIRRSKGSSAVFYIAALGGGERKLCDLNSELAQNLTWSPDGKLLAVVDSPDTSTKLRGISLIDAENGQITVLTRPPTDSFGDFIPIFSPDSSAVAFRRDDSVNSSIVTISTSGDNAQSLLTETTTVQSIFWGRSGSQIIYSAKRGAMTELFTVSPNGSAAPTLIANLGTQVAFVAIDETRSSIYALNRTKDVNIWQAKLSEDRQSLIDDSKLIAGPRIDEYPAYSSDGRRIAFVSDRTGSEEMWIVNSDGSNERRLSDLKGPVIATGEWSPNDTMLSFHSSVGPNMDIYYINTATGSTKQLTNGGKQFARNWSRDGKWVYYAKIDGEDTDLWKVSVETGESILVIPSANAGLESHDGRSLYFVRFNQGGVWKMDMATGATEAILDDSHFRGASRSVFTPAKDGFYILDRERKPEPLYEYFDLATASITKILSSGSSTGFSVAISPDGSTWLNARTDYAANEILRISTSGL